MQKTRQTIAIDIDDVVAKTTEAVRLWANQIGGVELAAEDYFITEAGYWNYYEAVWRAHSLEGTLSFADFLKTLNVNQAHIAVMDGAREAIAELKQYYDVIFITARTPDHKDSTREWLDERIDATVPLYLSHNPVANVVAQSKGELCAELGVSVLIDDNIDNCHSAVQYGVEAILFGNYGWNCDEAVGSSMGAVAAGPVKLSRYMSWPEITEYLCGRFQ